MYRNVEDDRYIGINLSEGLTTGVLTSVETGALDGIILPRLTKQVSAWQAQEPVLTVPDLEDTLEQMMARRLAGLSGNPPAGLGFQRAYPTDPTSVETASKFLAKLQAQTEQTLKEKAVIYEHEAQKRIEDKKQVELQQKEFKAFVLSQEALKNTKG